MDLASKTRTVARIVMHGTTQHRHSYGHFARLPSFLCPRSPATYAGQPVGTGSAQIRWIIDANSPIPTTGAGASEVVSAPDDPSRITDALGFRCAELSPALSQRSPNTITDKAGDSARRSLRDSRYESMNFFSTLARLAGSRQQENQLSQTFRACFDASPGFRQTVLKMIARACEASVDAQANWHCATQIAGPQGGRLDIHLSSPDRVDQPVFVLESKVGSTLNREQLLRYRSRRHDRTTHHLILIAITKHRPDVRIRVLARHKIRSLRWQDIHRALTAKRLRSPTDRFIAAAFAEFLEDGDMAYPQRLTLKDLQRASEALRALHRRNSREGVVVRQAFQALHSCAGLLHELGNDLREHVSSLATFHALRSCVSY